ncbi:hypothetical protein ACTFIY_001492 [Dictyostelium cf. discoideum]
MVKPKRSVDQLIEKTERIYDAIGQSLMMGNYSKAARQNGFTNNQLNYYLRDYRNGIIRQSHGGLRTKLKFTPEEYSLLVSKVIDIHNNEPNLSLRQISISINSEEGSIFQGKVNKTRIFNIFKQLGLKKQPPIKKSEDN